MWLYQPLVPSAELLAVPATFPGYVKIYTGTQWEYKPVKVWMGSSWEIKPAKWYDTATTSWKTTNGT